MVTRIQSCRITFPSTHHPCELLTLPAWSWGSRGQTKLLEPGRIWERDSFKPHCSKRSTPSSLGNDTSPLQVTVTQWV